MTWVGTKLSNQDENLKIIKPNSFYFIDEVPENKILNVKLKSTIKKQKPMKISKWNNHYYGRWFISPDKWKDVSQHTRITHQ